jgi:preprotein translocase subunit SecD
MKQSNWLRLFLLALLAASLLVVLPVHSGTLLHRDLLLGLDLKGGVRLVYQANLSGIEAGKVSEVLNGVVSVISNRVNPLGVSEPVISKQGTDRIVVELPGVNMSEEQMARIGRTALLEFREQQLDATGTAVKDEKGNTVWIPAAGTVNNETKTLTSSYFNSNTYVAANQTTGSPELHFEFNSEGAELAQQITSRLVGKQLAIYEGDEPLLDVNGYVIAPTVNDVISNSGVIEGLGMETATQLSQQLNAGRLPVALTIIQEDDVSPILGADFVGLSVKAGLIGLLLVMLFMVLYYRLPGVVASLALVFYTVLTLAIFKIVPVTLTLPGIAGFIVSIGMAVDANVLIFERLKEELNAGRTLGAAIEAGFNRAWSAIWDSNVTTFISCLVLYWIGSVVVAGSSIKGFALTLFIGVAVSMFTAITVTRTLMRLLVGTGWAKNLRLFKRMEKVDHV